MIVTIDKSEINAAKYACALCEYKANFYTNEVNDKVVNFELLESNGDEPSLKMIWYLARQIEAKLAIEAFSKK